MNISLTLVHNKTDVQNEAQIEALKPFIEVVTDGPFIDDEGNSYTTFHHEIKGLNIPHTLKIYQIIPYGVTPPPNRYDINSGGIVQYGEGDNDKTGDHPRFFNWALKRGTDNGADIAIYLQDISSLATQKIRGSLAKFTNDTEFVEETWGKLGSVRLLKQIGQFKEDRSFTDAVTEFKTRVTQGGLKNG